MNVKPDTKETADEDQPRISTGSEGLDDILGGGLDPNRMYLYEGSPWSGKTIIALQFLLDGVRQGERVLNIALCFGVLKTGKPFAPSIAMPA